MDSKPSAVHIAQDTKALLDYTNKSLQNRRHSTGFENDNHSNHSHSSLSISNIQQQSQEIPLRDRLTASGFTLVKWVGHVSGNTMTQGVLEVKDDDYYYAFILDNTSSKNVKKKTLFKAGVIDDDSQSMVSGKSTPSPVGTPRNSHGYSYQRDSVLRVDHGRYLQGYLSKKRRKKLQGFKKRFFTLDFRYGTLSYYLNDHNQTCRGELVISLSTVSANKKDRLIIIDSGMEVWVLKANDTRTWQNWIDALQSCFESQKMEQQPLCVIETTENEDTAVDDDQDMDQRTETINTSVRSTLMEQLQQEAYVPLSDETYATFTTNLKLIQQKLERCKNDSLSYSPTKSDRTKLVRSSSSSSSLHGGTRMKGLESYNPAMDSSESLVAPIDINPELPPEHELYQRLSELENFVGQFITQSEMLLRDFNHVKKHAKEISRVSMTSAFSDNEEYFDAVDQISHGVIILDDEEADEVEATRIMTKLSRSVTTPKSTSIDTTGTLTIEATNDLYPLPVTQAIKRRNDVAKSMSTPPSLLSFLRKNVGKDLSSIALPVTSNEPITILQMFSETFQYASLLPNGSTSDSQLPALSSVTLFAISFLSIQRDKTRSLRKPFNPLLGETFELVHDKMGFRLIAEKVSHKPQIFAFHADHEDWEFDYIVQPSQKFWGKSVEFNNEGSLKLKLKKSGEVFHWEQPTTLLKGLIAGERYVEPINDFEVISSLGSKAKIEFQRTGMFGGRSEEVVASVQDKHKKTIQTIVGKWTDVLKDSKTKKTLWEVSDLLKDSKNKYGFTKFTANLNEITDIERGHLPPTDSRLRPDVKAYENGKIDKAEVLKLELEQKQRERRTKGEDAIPRYFEKVSGGKWKYKRGPNSYWERRRRQDWSDVQPLW